MQSQAAEVVIILIRQRRSMLLLNHDSATEQEAPKSSVFDTELLRPAHLLPAAARPTPQGEDSGHCQILARPQVRL